MIYILLDYKCYANSTLLKNLGLKMIRKRVMHDFLLIFTWVHTRNVPRPMVIFLFNLKATFYLSYY